MESDSANALLPLLARSPRSVLAVLLNNQQDEKTSQTFSLPGDSVSQSSSRLRRAWRTCYSMVCQALFPKFQIYMLTRFQVTNAEDLVPPRKDHCCGRNAQSLVSSWLWSGKRWRHQFPEETRADKTGPEQPHARGQSQHHQSTSANTMRVWGDSMWAEWRGNPALERKLCSIPRELWPDSGIEEQQTNSKQISPMMSTWAPFSNTLREKVTSLSYKEI